MRTELDHNNLFVKGVKDYSHDVSRDHSRENSQDERSPRNTQNSRSRLHNDFNRYQHNRAMKYTKQP